MAEPLDDLAEAQVVGPEVVAPGGDAVRLVDDEQRRLASRTASTTSGLASCSGARKTKRTVPSCSASSTSRWSPADIVELSGRPAGPVLDLGEPLDLVALQGDQRGDDHDRAVEQLAGDLVDRRLAGAGRQDGEGVRAGHDRLHGRLLAGPELLEAQDLARELADPAGADGGRGAGGVVVRRARGAWWHRPGCPRPAARPNGVPGYDFLAVGASAEAPINRSRQLRPRRRGAG